MRPSSLRNVASPTHPDDFPSKRPAVSSSSQFQVDREDLVLLQNLTGITDEKELEEHITHVQKKANQIHDYPCISMFTFTKFNIKLSPNYEHVLSLARARKDAIFLDVGCCVGNALRKVVADGWPAECAIGIDLYEEFWDVGHELFKSSSDSFPASFIAGDIFDDTILAPNAEVSQNLETPKLRDITSLSPLQHRISVIYACNVFHLFNSEKQLDLAKRLASLLTPTSGSVIFGSHGVFPSQRSILKDGKQVSFHTAESFANMWNEIFEPNTVNITWKIKSRPQQEFSALGRWDIIWWSVTRL